MQTGMDGDDASGIYVLGLVAEGAGAKAGIAQGDRILALDGTSLVGKTPFQAASDIAAATGPALRLEVQSCGEPPRLLTVRKPESAAPKSPVESYMTESKFGRGRRVGYVRLSSLNALAQRDVSAAVRSLESNGAEEIVLDLRDNRGGLVSEGVEVAGLFLDEGDRVVLTEGTRTPRDPQTAGGKPLTRLPVTVLVSGRTASAAEILAGAIKDNCRGVVVGERTYGKGLIQSVFELADGSGLVVTVGRYLTPSGTDIDLTGVLPDFRSVPSREQAEGRLKLCRAER